MKYDVIFKNETITLSKGNDGFWLYDYTRGMNLAMKAKTEQDAFISALMYYQKRLTEVETKHNKLQNRVDNFIEEFTDEE